MKRLIVIILANIFIFTCMFFSSCEPAPNYWKFQFTNNSIDTIGIAVFEHKKISKDNSYICIQKEYPIIPSNTISSWIAYDGDGSDLGDSWRDFFVVSKIDTLCIIVCKNPLNYQYGKTYEIYSDSCVRKMYKYHDGNVDLKGMISPTFTYP